MRATDDKKRKVQRWILRLLIGDGGLRSLDDAEAMGEAHLVYRKFKDAEARKEVAEDEMEAQGAILAHSLKGGW